MPLSYYLCTVTPLVYLQAGSGQNFLFLYRGSWLVAADPLSNSLTYRMFQRSGAARTPDTCTDTWHVVNNDGTISQTSQARVLPTISRYQLMLRNYSLEPYAKCAEK